MKVLIIEDETAAARNLQSILQQVAPAIEVLDVLESVEESVAWLRTHPAPDLLFMDIHLADGESFRILDAVEITAPVIFTTAYDQYALEAFRLCSIDYLLKPLAAADVRRALDKLERLTGSERTDYGSRVRQAVHRCEETRSSRSTATGSPSATRPTSGSRPTTTTVRSIRSTRRSKRCRPPCPRRTFSAPTGSSSSPAAPCRRSPSGSAAAFR